jgi:hypothetical protein
MKKWTISALVYLFVIVGGYYVYASFTEPEYHNDTNSPHEKEAVASHGQEHQENGENHDGKSEVIPNIQVENGELIII